MGAGIIQFF